MRSFLSLTFAILLVTGSLGLADARGHRGSHRFGGINSHGKGSHYEGGIGVYGRHARRPRHFWIYRPAVIPQATGAAGVTPAFVTPVAAVAPPAFVTPVAPIPQPAPVDAAPILTILIIAILIITIFATAAFLLLRALAALAKYIARIPMRLLRARATPSPNTLHASRSGCCARSPPSPNTLHSSRSVGLLGECVRALCARVTPRSPPSRGARVHAGAGPCPKVR
jgi:hypothetical protein